jgi:secreted trypsin-like serine protease
VATAYPEAVLIQMYEDGQFSSYCSGSLIAPTVVLTAGHCVYGFNGFTVKAPFAQNQSAQANGAALYDWSNDSEFVDPNQHDVALIFLATPIDIATYPTIATSGLASGSKVRNIGRIRNGVLSNTKLYIGRELTVRPGSQVGFPFAYATAEVIESGDSGGPVVKTGTHQIVAVNSGGGGGSQVLARVDLVADWIHDQVDAQGGGTEPEPEPEPEDPCGGVTFAGRCNGNTVQWCENEQLQSLACSGGRTCGFDSANDYYNCL